MAKIGFIGVGHMGGPMVLNLLKHNHSVTIFDISKEALKPLQKEGARVASSPLELARSQDFIFTSLQTGDQVKHLCEGSQGIFSVLSPQTIFIDCSSIDIHQAHQLHDSARKAHLHMLDAPVSGGVAGATAGTLTFMVGGEKEVLEKAKPILKCLGSRIIHTGPGGSGQAAKICNNLLLAISMIGVCEAMALAEKLHLSTDVFFDVASHSSGQCWSLSQYCPVPGPVPSAPSNRDYEPGFTGHMMLKDLTLSQNAAQHVKLLTPLGHAATQLYHRWVDKGEGQKDFSGIIELIRTLK